MKPCDRCEKAGDIACIEFIGKDDQPTLVAALHKNGTVSLPDTSDATLLRLLAFITKTWLETSFSLVLVLTSAKSPQQFKDAIENGFLKLRYYGTMEGAVREYLRANGRSFDDIPPATQPEGRA